MSYISTGNKGRVTGNQVNVRKNAGTDSPRLYYAKIGDIVTVLDGTYDTKGYWWYKIKNETRYTNTLGWIRSDYVESYNGNVWVRRYINTPVGQTVNVRSCPDKNCDVVRTLSRGTEVQVNNPTSTWTEVRLPGQSILGYVMTQYLSISHPDGGSSGGDTSSCALKVGYFCKVTKNSVKFYSTPARTHYIGYLHSSAEFIVDSIVKDSSGPHYSVGIRWGGANNSTIRYVRDDMLALSTRVASNHKENVIHIAKGLALSTNNTSATSGKYRYTENTLEIPAGTDGGWCQRFMYFLCKAAGVPSNLYPSFDASLCSQGVKFMNDRSSFSQGKSTVPKAGDWLYTGSGPQHVVFVYHANENMLDIVEGNNSADTLGRRTINYSTLDNVYGVASPKYDI